MGSGRGQRRRANASWWAQEPGWDGQHWQDFLEERKLLNVSFGAYYGIPAPSNEAEQEPTSKAVAEEILRDLAATGSITLPVGADAKEFGIIINPPNTPPLMELELSWRGKREHAFNFPHEFLSPEKTFGSADGRFACHHLGVAAALLLK